MARTRASTVELPRLIAGAARRLLDRDGPAGVTYRGVAAEAGVAVRSIQNRFDSMADLLDHVALRGFGELRDHIVGAEDRALHTVGDPSETLDVALDRYREWALANPHVHRLLFDGPAHGVTPSPFTRRAALDVLRLFDAAARCDDTGRRRFVEELGRVQLTLSGLLATAPPPTSRRHT